MWLFFSLASRFLWSGANAIDQVMSRAHATHKMRSVLVLQLCAYAPFAVAGCFLSGDLHWSPEIFYLLAPAMVVYAAGQWLYFYALQREQACNIVPYLEMTPVFVTLMAMALYHDHLTPLQILGGFIVIFCGFVFSWDFEHGKIKKRIFALMALASFCFAAYQIAIKSAAAYGDVWMVTSYFSSTIGLIGFIMLLTMSKVRKTIVHTARATGGRTVFMALGSNFLSFLAMASLVYAFKTAPSTGHVAALSGSQPFFSFLLAGILGVILPHHYEPLKMGHELRLKLLLVFGIFLGIYLLACA